MLSIPLVTTLPILLSTTASGAPTTSVWANPAASDLANPKFGPRPGNSPLYSTYYGKPGPFPANITEPIAAKNPGKPEPDDILWQNLLSAEWIVYSFYQAGVEAFNSSSFTSIGLPNTTYQRIMEIRDNEAGHLRIFQDQISAKSMKPGACKYKYPFDSPESFLALQVFIEVSSMAFLTGLVQQAVQNSTKGALTAVSQVETRHEAWALIDNWGAEPFSGPSDVSYPYANQILESTNIFVVPGSCPSANPLYPFPAQHLASVKAVGDVKSISPGSTIELNVTSSATPPRLLTNKTFYAVFYHGVDVVSVPLNISNTAKPISVTIPAQFESRGLIVGNIACTENAPHESDVVAGPFFLLQQPKGLGLQFI